MTTVTLNTRELDTVLAALRYWQRYGDSLCDEASIADDGGNQKPLNEFEIDELCERINTPE